MVPLKTVASDFKMSYHWLVSASFLRGNSTRYRFEITAQDLERLIKVFDPIRIVAYTAACAAWNSATYDWSREDCEVGWTTLNLLLRFTSSVNAASIKDLQCHYHMCLQEFYSTVHKINMHWPTFYTFFWRFERPIMWFIWGRNFVEMRLHLLQLRWKH